jgi:hypothetical protein
MPIEVIEFICDQELGAMPIFTDDRTQLSVAERAVVLEALKHARLGAKFLLSSLMCFVEAETPTTCDPFPVPDTMIAVQPYGLGILTHNTHTMIAYRFHKALRFSDGRELLGDMIVEARTKQDALRGLQIVWPKQNLRKGL